MRTAAGYVDVKYYAIQHVSIQYLVVFHFHITPHYIIIIIITSYSLPKMLRIYIGSAAACEFRKRAACYVVG